MKLRRSALGSYRPISRSTHQSYLTRLLWDSTTS
uniref:Uncharacterized protein n=1 Tax=Anguilla anguilla TaxID=7936 RepID=A0A0E9W9M6_ANGAN